MTRARREQVCLDETPYYHCISRCVRRAFLCGEDHHTGQSYEHRRQWIVDRMKLLAGVFAIDICAYAVMSNHYHLVMRINQEEAQGWGRDEVIERWYKLYNGSMLVDRYLAGEALGHAELAEVNKVVSLWRLRLHDISWFMRCLNESIARQANEEDDCKGRFWEGRYKSQALLDEAALLTCMMYVDLNPIRAGISRTPEASEFTSIQERIKAYQAERMGSERPDVSLVDFTEGQQQEGNELPIRRNDYFELLDWTGRAIRNDKKGSIPENLAHILDRIDINPDRWLSSVRHVEGYFQQVIGCIDRLRALCDKRGSRWIRGMGSSRRVFKCAPA